VTFVIANGRAGIKRVQCTQLNPAPPSYCFCAAAMVRVITLGNKELPGVNIVQSEMLYVKIDVPCGSHNLKFTSWWCYEGFDYSSYLFWQL